MSEADPTPPNFRPDAFAGTAIDYARYRLPYPEALLADLIRRAGVTGEGRLMDLACGPGRVALALAASFREVWAVDLEPEMIAEGRNEADRRGYAHARWTVGRAEDVAAPAATFELITVGDAFHRLDQPVVARQALTWLAPGGRLAILGSDGVLEGAEPWQPVLREVVRRWTGLGTSAPGAPAALSPASGPDHNERVLREAGFVDVASHDFAHAHVWTTESLLGHLRSTSYASRRALGSHAEAFADDLEAALLACDPGGFFRQRVRFGYTLARAPGACPAAPADR